jgi:hypothetical protein
VEIEVNVELITLEPVTVVVPVEGENGSAAIDMSEGIVEDTTVLGVL